MLLKQIRAQIRAQTICSQKNNKKIKFLSCNKVELSKHKISCVAKYLLFEQTNGWNTLRPFGTCGVRAGPCQRRTPLALSVFGRSFPLPVPLPYLLNFIIFLLLQSRGFRDEIQKCFKSTDSSSLPLLIFFCHFQQTGSCLFSCLM